MAFLITGCRIQCERIRVSAKGRKKNTYYARASESALYSSLINTAGDKNFDCAMSAFKKKNCINFLHRKEEGPTRELNVTPQDNALSKSPDKKDAFMKKAESRER